MNLHQMEIFHKLAITKSVTITANELGIKQPTVSFHLKKLEEEIGVQLYNKRPNIFTLTPAGKMLQTYTAEILSLVQETERVMKDYQTYRRGELLIGASHIPANYILPPVLSIFTEKNQNIHLSLTVQSTPITVQMIKERKIDFGIVSEQNMHDDTLEIHRVTDDDLVLILSPDHPLNTEKAITIDDLQGEKFILHKQGSTREMINRWSQDENIKLLIKMELSSIEAICTMVKMKSGISIISKRAVNTFIEHGHLVARPVPKMPVNRYISVIYRKDRPITPLMRQFISLVPGVQGNKWW
ncbi:LysR family transcriptional regulator [Virgibacillus oceani]